MDKIVIGEDEEKYFQIGTELPLDEKEELVRFLKRNLDVFAWSAYEVPGVVLEFICHSLNVNLKAVLRKQQPRWSFKVHAEAVKEEIWKLKQAWAIKEIFYPEWLAKKVVVKKKSEKWRVCVDFTNLNKACPKDPFSVLRINQLVDATYGHPRMSLLDTFQEYHQILLTLLDQEKTNFLTLTRNYHYRVMPFGPKNAESTY